MGVNNGQHLLSSVALVVRMTWGHIDQYEQMGVTRGSAVYGAILGLSTTSLYLPRLSCGSLE